MLLLWLMKTRLVSLKTAIEEARVFMKLRDWYPVYFEMDWVRY